eukprot:Lithocolla_globosa_v1_NODE_5071_length_1309_cov_356.782297.p2 type:complete len:112 gc:universal NODE_5071_length_1309_cov_356.782297:956-1291(+)
MFHPMRFVDNNVRRTRRNTPLVNIPKKMLNSERKTMFCQRTNSTQCFNRMSPSTTQLTQNNNNKKPLNFSQNISLFRYISQRESVGKSLGVFFCFFLKKKDQGQNSGIESK